MLGMYSSASESLQDSFRIFSRAGWARFKASDFVLDFPLDTLEGGGSQHPLHADLGGRPTLPDLPLVDLGGPLSD